MFNTLQIIYLHYAFEYVYMYTSWRLLLECFDPILIRYCIVEAVTYSVLVYFLEHTVKSMFTLQRTRHD